MKAVVWHGQRDVRVDNVADPSNAEDLATHTLPLDEAPHGYEIFQQKQDGAIKVLLKPQESAA